MRLCAETKTQKHPKSFKTHYTRGVSKTHRPNSLPPASGVGIKTLREGPGSQHKKGGGEKLTDKEKEKNRGQTLQGLLFVTHYTNIAT